MWRRPVLLLTAGVVAAASSLMGACSSEPSGATTAAPATALGVTDAVAVSVRNYAFDPLTITATAGTPVTWTVLEGTHEMVATEGASFDSGPIGAGSTFTWSPDVSVTGKVSYRCAIHPTQMTGTIDVNG